MHMYFFIFAIFYSLGVKNSRKVAPQLIIKNACCNHAHVPNRKVEHAWIF